MEIPSSIEMEESKTRKAISQIATVTFLLKTRGRESDAYLGHSLPETSRHFYVNEGNSSNTSSLYIFVLSFIHVV